MRRIGMGGKYPAMVKPYHSIKNIPDKFFNWFSGKTGGQFIVHTRKELNKQAKSTLINNIVKLEKLVFNLGYELYKSKLPRLKTIKRKALPYNGRIDKRRKKKRKFSRKQLAAQRLFAKRARAGTLRK
jgi:hypothetical protein